jgi:hypothetical protein
MEVERTGFERAFDLRNVSPVPDLFDTILPVLVAYFDQHIKCSFRSACHCFLPKFYYWLLDENNELAGISVAIAAVKSLCH